MTESSAKPINLADRVVRYFAPASAMRRAQARQILAYYEAGRADTLRKQRRETGSGNDAVLRAGTSLRQQARHLEQNYDIALGVLNTLVTNTVGANGIGVEPQPRAADGSIDIELAEKILTLWKDWGRVPEVTRQHDWPAAQRVLARTWLRDGEVFSQLLPGTIAYLDHGTQVPLSIEMLEADYVPLDKYSSQPSVVQGIELNAWGAATGYHVYKSNPVDSASPASLIQTKRIPAQGMLHLAMRHRIRQLRGVSVFASVMNRFDDLKDYEESERIAAKVAASMAAFIKKGSPDEYSSELNATPRAMQFRPGIIFDDLRPGEEIGTIDTNRPNPNLETYRSGQIKAVAAGTGPSYSSIARTYDGTYSAQRQELVESWGAYAVLAQEFTSRIVRPIYEQFVALAVASGQLRVPRGLRPGTLDDAEYIGTQMPWIDPLKEVESQERMEDRGYVSGMDIVRRRGGNPISTLDQQQRWLQLKRDRGIPPPPGYPEKKPPDQAAGAEP